MHLSISHRTPRRRHVMRETKREREREKKNPTHLSPGRRLVTADRRSPHPLLDASHLISSHLVSASSSIVVLRFSLCHRSSPVSFAPFAGSRSGDKPKFLVQGPGCEEDNSDIKKSRRWDGMRWDPASFIRTTAADGDRHLFFISSAQIACISMAGRGQAMIELMVPLDIYTSSRHLQRSEDNNITKQSRPWTVDEPRQSLIDPRGASACGDCPACSLFPIIDECRICINSPIGGLHGIWMDPSCNPSLYLLAFSMVIIQEPVSVTAVGTREIALLLSFESRHRH